MTTGKRTKPELTEEEQALLDKYLNGEPIDDSKGGPLEVLMKILMLLGLIKP